MTITKGVTSEMFERGATNTPQLIRMDQRFSSSSKDFKQKASTIGWWTTQEHEKFLEAIELYPSGPWKKIAHHIGTRSPRQVMTHAQKYRQRIKRHRKSRTESKAVSSTAGDSILEMMPAIDSPIAGQEEETLLEVLQLEPLPLLQPCESEISWQPSKEMLALDALLLDELEQLIAPAENILVEPASLNGDALMELVVDTSVDWTPVNCMLLS
ncbi:Myb-like DNA-binding domain [Phytophthora infestans]|uniref:Myb-like DNA-binding domain n=1 Tax=Phytophthora infestans TaxID=4787 RepID=A0A833WNV5_PHYIN|nr:Myb-like DNA-binding domain [Phytophthora infestans]KAF4138273.1 Myb-like DNA-binding domain [Phytophthora infestans]KAI9996877.1 hypothetical protein PInf_000140 [Phytophthora infestans]